MMKIRRPMSSRPFSRFVSLLAVLVFSACSGPVGNGIGPIRLVVNGPTGVQDAATAREFLCIRNQITATLFFSDGSAGDFTGRVRWASSNPAVIRISNGEEPVEAPGTGFFARGVLTPVAPGASTVTASYLGLTDSIDITVGTPTNFQVHNVDPQTGLRIDPTDNTFRIGVGTSRDLTVTAMLDNVLTNVDGAATWSFDVPNTAEASINPASGLLIGIAAGAPLTARASFAPCSITAATTVSVASVTGISIVPEFGAANVIVGTSERFTVVADLGNGPEQDITPQTVLTSPTPAVATFGSILSQNILQALTAGGPLNIGATFVQQATPTTTTTLTAPTVPVSTVVDTLQSVALTPATASIVAGSADIVTYRLIGTYVSGATEDITRQASLTTSDSTIAQIITGGLLAGQAISSGITPGTVTFTATIPLPTGATGTAPTATATFTTTAAPAVTP